MEDKETRIARMKEARQAKQAKMNKQPKPVKVEPRPSEAFISQELPQLTEKQYNYVTERLSGKSRVEAYRSAYDVRPETLYASIASDASRLESNPIVSQWLQAGRRDALSKSSYSMEMYLQQLDEVRTRAQDAGQFGAAAVAIYRMGQAAGHDVPGVKTTIGSDIGTALRQLALLLGTELAIRTAIDRLGYSMAEATRIIKGELVEPLQIEADDADSQD